MGWKQLIFFSWDLAKVANLNYHYKSSAKRKGCQALSLATVYSRALIGVEAVEVTVETHLSNGLPGFAIVGLPETAVKESKERVRSAILNTGL